MKIENSHFLITGGNRGIGLNLAKEINRRGGIVHVTARRPDDQLKEEFSQSDNVHIHKLDMSNAENIENFWKDFCSKDIPVDCLINNAGQLTGGLLEEQPTQDIYSMMQTNITGLIHLTKLVVPKMLERKKGKIVNNSSVSGVMHLPCASTYAAAKAGVVAFTNSLRAEFKGTGLNTLLLVTPGIKTRMFDAIPSKYGDYMDVSKLASIPPEQYANEVVDYIEKDKELYWPGGSLRFPLFLAKHFPFAFSSLAKKEFSRP